MLLKWCTNGPVLQEIGSTATHKAELERRSHQAGRLSFLYEQNNGVPMNGGQVKSIHREDSITDSECCCGWFPKLGETSFTEWTGAFPCAYQ
jgi:hypothetical protein